MVGVRAVLAAHVTALMDADALAPMEDLDGSRGDPHLDLGADERVRDRIQKVMDLDVIVEIDPRAPPFRELPIVGGQGDEGVALDLHEQLATANPTFSTGDASGWKGPWNQGWAVEGLHYMAGCGC